MHNAETTQVFDTPILFLVFNRVNHTKKVFETIRRIAPSKLYIASDGPRLDKPGERERVYEIRNYLTQNIDWECKVETLFRDPNLGCKYAVSEAINWFFKNEEFGIILEDDCLPSHSFYLYCDKLLKRYKDDDRIWLISGFNPLDGIYSNKESYVFTYFGFCWGWATWRRAWNHFDVDMNLWPKAKSDEIIHTYPFFKERCQEFEETYNKRIDTWDYQWYFAIASNNGLSAVPNNNLVKNIGFDQEATHTFKDHMGRGKIDNKEIPQELVHPSFIIRNKGYEDAFLKNVVVRDSFITKMYRKVKTIFNLS